jgi:predicted dehydrogenase
MPDDPADLPQADVVLLAIPFGVREPFYEAFAKRGCGLYVEKPFARTLAAHDHQCQMFAEERIACGFQRRSTGVADCLRELIRLGTFGALRSVRIGMGGPGLTTGERYSADLQMAGGGILLETGIHALDFVLYVCDAVSAQATSVEMVKHDGFDIHTEASLRIATRAGSELTVDLLVSSLRYTTMSNVYVFETSEVVHEFWSTGVLKLSPHGGSNVYVIGGDMTEYPATSAQSFHSHWLTFLDGLGSRELNRTVAICSRVTTQAVEDIYSQGEL